MNYLATLLVLVALVVCTMAQWPYYQGAYYNTHAGVYPYAYNWAGYNPAHTYLWK